MIRHTLILVALILSCFSTLGRPPVASAVEIQGQVYFDANQNGRADDGEAGMADVLVSNGRQVVATDASGTYRLDRLADQTLVWISVPKGHAAADRFWRLADGEAPDQFGLVARDQGSDFTFLQITDTHIGRDDLLKQFAASVARLPVPIAFVVNTGDLVGGVDVVLPEKAQAQFDRYFAATAAFEQPLYHLPGNHEHVAFNVEDADPTHPFYGKGLYRKLLGPTYYSWDWGDVHFIALDGTSLPYQEKLGAEQLEWLKADLEFQPAGKPLVVFCHQSLPKLRDAGELEQVLRGRRVLGAFCGHLHSTFTTQMADFPVYHSGALSGAWWSGPNPDGSPQGFRLVQIAGGQLKTAYTSREGAYPLCVVAPSASSVQSGQIETEVQLVDFGRPVQVSAWFEGNEIPLKPAGRDELWSTWKTALDTTLARDGDRTLKVVSKLGAEISSSETRYLIVNDRRDDSYRPAASALLSVQVRAVDAVNTVLLDGESLGVIPADTPAETTLTFPIDQQRLGKLNRVTVRAAAQGAAKDQFSVGPVWLEYQGKRIHDLRYPTFGRHTIGGNDPQRGEQDLYFCLPN